MSSGLTLLVIAATMLGGYWLYLNFAGGANAAYDAVATASAGLWVLAGVFAVMGGFVVVGGVLILLFTYVGLSKGSKTKERLQSRLAG